MNALLVFPHVVKIPIVSIPQEIMHVFVIQGIQGLLVWVCSW